MKKRKLYIGTSGWAYNHWIGIFYPKELPSKDRLKYFSSYFNTAEINYSFYHLPTESTYKKWYQETPKDFVFSVKASRFITHIKRLKGVKIAWKKFLQNALHLKEKLGPILFQFPPSFKATNENIKRVEEFLENSQRIREKKFAKDSRVKLAFEFRHPSWCSQEIYKLLEKYNAAWVIADSKSYPKEEICTSDFVYIRMHGPGELFASKYSDSQIKKLSNLIKKYLKNNKEVYVYFNNDFYGYAIENAKTLKRLCPKI